jgi:hypothetical protein
MPAERGRKGRRARMLATPAHHVSEYRSLPSSTGGYSPSCLEGGLSDVLIRDTGGD